MQVRRISSPPQNAAAFIAETAAGLGSLYGPAAAAHYLSVAPDGMRAALAHASLYAIAAWDNGAQALGCLTAVQRPPAAHITYLHVLQPFEGRGVEKALVERAAADLRQDGLDHIACECVPFCRLNLTPAFRACGFEHIERLLMLAPLRHRSLCAIEQGVEINQTLRDEPRPVAACTPTHWEDVAGCLVDAYRDGPGRRLHIDVSAPELAYAFVSRAATGAFGRVRPGYMLAVFDAGRCVGAVLGCEIAPNTGFVLQVAVRPEYRRRGIAGRLLQRLAEAFRDAGLTQAALGVTKTNPARSLYERLGFAPLRDVDAYVWWRPGAAPGTPDSNSQI